MAKFDIDFTWYRDTRGYRLVGPDLERYGETIRENRRLDAKKLFQRNRWTGNPLGFYERLVARRKAADFRHIVGCSGKLEPYRPLQHFETLYWIFATTVSSAEEAVSFANRFGHLWLGVGPYGEAQPHPSGEQVSMILDEAERMRKVVTASRVDGMINVGSINLRLKTSPATGKLQIGFIPDSLRAALWLQLAEANHEDATIHQCLHCGVPFSAGPGSGRRRDAKFCSPEHQRTFNSLKRSRGA